MSTSEQQPPSGAVPIPPSTFEPEGDVVTDHEEPAALCCACGLISCRPGEAVCVECDPSIEAAGGAS